MSIKDLGVGIGLSSLAAGLLFTSNVSACTNTINNSLNSSVVFDAYNNSDEIREYSETIKDVEYTLTIDLSESKHYLEEKQLEHIKNLFFDAYPKMYDRFGGYNGAPTDITIEIMNGPDEDGDDYFTYRDGDTIYLNEYYLDKENNYDDFDVLTSCLGYIIENGWDFDHLEFGADSEGVFSCYCRYIYAYKDGRYLDKNWRILDDGTKKERKDSIGFLVWLDEKTSNSNIDIIRDYFEVCSNDKHSSWDKEWKTLLKGTDFEGKSIEEVYNIYLDSEFIQLDSTTDDKDAKSELIQKNDVRTKIKNHSYSEYYVNNH